MAIPKKSPSLTRILNAMDIADDARRRNPSRYTSDGYLKPVCAACRPYKDSLACEVCGTVAGEHGAMQ